jgi:chromosome segregation ATPase
MLNTVEQFRQHVDEIESTMNELSESIGSIDSQPASAQLAQLNERFVHCTMLRNELDKRRAALEQLQCQREQLRFDMANGELIDSIKSNARLVENREYRSMTCVHIKRQENMSTVRVCVWRATRQLCSLCEISSLIDDRHYHH